MAEDPKPFSVVKMSFLIGIGFAVVWMVLPPGKMAERVFPEAAEPSVRQLDSKEVFLRELSSELNASLPIRVDQDTRWDTTIAGPGNRFTYFYTSLSMTADDITASQFKDEISRMKQYGINSGFLEEFFKDGTIVAFRIADEKGNRIGDFVITPEDAGY